MASGIYNIFKYRSQLSSGSSGLNWSDLSTGIRVMLLTTGYSFNKDQTAVSDGTTSDLQSNESSGTNYTKGFNSASRKAIDSRTASVDQTNDRAALDGANVTWTAVNVGKIQGAAVIYEPTSVGSTDTKAIPICFFEATDLSTAGITTNGGDLTISWSTVGLMTLT